MPSLRILMITARADYGGGPEHLYRLINALPSDIQPFVACPREAPYWERFVRQVGPCRMLEIPHRKLTLRYFVRLARFVRRQQIDLIHSHGRGAGLYGRLLGFLSRMPCIHTFHGLRTETDSGGFPTLNLGLERLLARRSCRLIAVSRGEQDSLLAAKVCSPARLRLIPNGVCLPERWLSEGPCRTGKHRIVSMSRFTYQKNTELLLPMLEQLRKWNRLDTFHFLLLGTGPGEARLRSALDEHGFGACVTFCGAVSDPQTYLHTAFCYLSTSRWEGMSLALLEAMAIGLPIVATNVVGNRDVVKHERTGLLYEQSAPQTAVQHLLALEADTSLWRRLSQAARHRAVTHYGVHRMALETAEVYREVCSKTTAMTPLPDRWQ